MKLAASFSGELVMSLGTPETIDMTLMFLYGEKPQFTTDNYCSILELAEFFLIPNLKAAVVSWLKRLPLTPEICVDVLQLSYKYGIDFPNVSRYIEGNLPEMLIRPEMLTLSEDSVRYILTEKKLSYVPVDDKVKFVSSWIKFDPTNRLSTTEELLKFIDFSVISKTLLDELRNDPIVGNFFMERTLNENNTDLQVEVSLIETKVYYKRTFWCYHHEKSKWYSLELDRCLENGDLHTHFNYKFVGFNRNSAELSFLDAKQQIHRFDIITSECKLMEVVQTDTDSTETANFVKLVCYGNVYVAFGVDQGLHSTVYYGYERNDKIEMKTLFPLRNCKIQNICLNENSTLALLVEGGCFLFDMTYKTIERIAITTSSDDHLCASKDEHIIFNNKRCICISRLAGPSLPTMYLAKELSFEEYDHEKPGYTNKYIFSGKRWFRYYRESYDESCKLLSVSHDTLMSAETFSDIDWEVIALPRMVSNCQLDFLGDFLGDFIVDLSLPKHKLLCDVDCPHCNESEDDSEECWSDSDYCDNDECPFQFNFW